MYKWNVLSEWDQICKRAAQLARMHGWYKEAVKLLAGSIPPDLPFELNLAIADYGNEADFGVQALLELRMLLELMDRRLDQENVA